jgi:DNA-binding XRE family transcriptional regulator
MTYKPRRQLAPMKSARTFERAMKRRDINVTELARMIQLSRTSMSRIRSGWQVPSVDTATAIERALAVEHGALFEFDTITAAATHDTASAS